MARLRLAGAGAIGAATTHPAGVPVAVHSDGSDGVPPVGLTVALLDPSTPPVAVCGVTLIVNAAVAPAVIPLAVVIEHTNASPSVNRPDDAHEAAVLPLLGAALLNTKLGGNLSLITILRPEVAAPTPLPIVSK